MFSSMTAIKILLSHLPSKLFESIFYKGILNSQIEKKKQRTNDIVASTVPA